MIFQNKSQFYSEFSEARLNHQMVNCPDCLVISCSTWRWWRYRYQNEQITTCWDVLQPIFWFLFTAMFQARVLAHAVGFKNYILVVAVRGLGSPSKFDDVVTGLIKDDRFRYFHATVELPRLQKDWKLKSYSKHGNGGSWGYKPSKYRWFIIAIWKWWITFLFDWELRNIAWMFLIDFSIPSEIGHAGVVAADVPQPTTLHVRTRWRLLL